jgi:hypothetical protein
MDELLAHMMPDTVVLHPAISPFFAIAGHRLGVAGHFLQWQAANPKSALSAAAIPAHRRADRGGDVPTVCDQAGLRRLGSDALVDR